MAIIIEIDNKFTIGIDWYKETKGIRLGFIAIHVVFTSFETFVNTFIENGEKIK